MHTFFQKLRALADFIISVSLVYLALTVAFSSMLVNFILIIIDVFVLLQCLGCIDKINGYGPKNHKITPPGEPEGEEACDES